MMQRKTTSDSTSKFTDLTLGSTHLVEVQGLGSFGEGIARIGDLEIFIPKTMARDRVEIKILEKKKGRYRAEVVQLLEPGPERVEARCQHFSICGGCDFQHLPYQEQMAWKLRMTKHWIRRSPLAPQLEKIHFHELDSPQPFEYRHRVRLQVKDGKLHFFRPHSNRLFELKECPIMVKGFFKALEAKAVTVVEQRDWNQVFSEEKLVDQEAHYEIDGHRLGFDEKCFTQANFPVNQKIWNFLRAEIEQMDRRERALDLFCGIGNFSIPLKDYFQKVIGVESEGQSIAWARKNSDQVEWVAALAENFLSQWEQGKDQQLDLVLLDPPRAGARACMEILRRVLPTRILYVSCSLESLIPDLVLLTKKGRYKIESWAVADLFPQTHHIESVVSLKLSL